MLNSDWVPSFSLGAKDIIRKSGLLALLFCFMLIKSNLSVFQIMCFGVLHMHVIEIIISLIFTIRFILIWFACCSNKLNSLFLFHFHIRFFCLSRFKNFLYMHLAFWGEWCPKIWRCRKQYRQGQSRRIEEAAKLMNMCHGECFWPKVAYRGALISGILKCAIKLKIFVCTKTGF